MAHSETNKSIAILYRQLPCQRVGFFHNSSVTKTKTEQDPTMNPLTVNDSVYSSVYRGKGEQDHVSSLQLPKGVASALHEKWMGIPCTDLDLLYMHNKYIF